jgi:hypothetical protein
MKIPRRGFAGNWVAREANFSMSTSSFAREFVPPTFACQWRRRRQGRSTFESQDVLLKARVTGGFDMGQIPDQITYAHDAQSARKGLDLGWQLQAFFRAFGLYEQGLQEEDEQPLFCNSLFDVSPSNVMIGTIFPDFSLSTVLERKENGNDDAECVAPAQRPKNTATATARIWLVDFTVHHKPFFRPDYIWNDKRVAEQWGELAYPTDRGGGEFFMTVFFRARAWGSSGGGGM